MPSTVIRLPSCAIQASRNFQRTYSTTSKSATSATAKGALTCAGKTSNPAGQAITTAASISTSLSGVTLTVGLSSPVGASGLMSIRLPFLPRLVVEQIQHLRLHDALAKGAHHELIAICFALYGDAAGRPVCDDLAGARRGAARRA